MQIVDVSPVAGVDFEPAGAPGHVERGEREILPLAVDFLAKALGGAASIIVCGQGSRHGGTLLAAACERVKAIHVFDPDPEPSQLATLGLAAPTAEITHHPRSAAQGDWPQPSGAGGGSAILALGGILGHWTHAAAQTFLQACRQVLSTGDGLLVSCELPQDGAQLEAHHLDFGQNLVRQRLGQMTRNLGFEARVCFDPSRLEMMYTARLTAPVALNIAGTETHFQIGDTVICGRSRLLTASDLAQLDPHFELDRVWTSSDGAALLALLRKR